MGNRTFFKEVREDKMSLGDIFSDILKGHTEEETASVFIGGTPLTTPKEEDMLAKWQKPFLFARYFISIVVVLLVCYAMWSVFNHPGGLYLMIVGVNFVIPVTLLLLVWEMHIPRNISLFDVMKMMVIGGILSMFTCLIGFAVLPDMSPVWAGLAEEPAKLLLVYYFLSKKDKKYILDGVLIGVAVGTGFAVFESIYYSMDAFITSGVEVGFLATLLTGNIEASQVGVEIGAQIGILQALGRAFAAVMGHGVYAGLYGGGILMAKQSEKLSPRHLFSVDFLKYFVLAIGLHAYNNMGVNVGLPVLFNGTLPLEIVIEGVIGMVILLDILKKGVNQVVRMCAEKNGGRVTMAVNRGNAGANYNAAPRVILEAISGPYMGRTYAIGLGQEMTIGRTEGKNGIALPACKNASSIHCQIVAENGQLKIKDLNSTNGTYIGDQKLMPYQDRYVGEGTIIYIADRNCGFRVRVQ